jgi:hypothetical protein
MKRFKTKAAILTFIFMLMAAVGFFIKSHYLDHEVHRLNAIREIRKLEESGSLKEGDILFQTSRSGQSRAIQLATHSQYSHCGILYKMEGKYYVFEAVQPVRTTPLQDWVQRGKEGRFAIRRLRNSETILTPSVLLKMRKAGQPMAGRSYDLQFSWTDRRLYCSELVWKIYRHATGLELGRLQKLRDFDLSQHAVKRKLAQRYGNRIPLDEPLISPARLFESNLLVTVKSTY